MYLKCGLMSDAHELFGKIPARNLTTWDTMIVGLAENGYGEDAIHVFTEFKEAGGRPNGQMFLGVIYACSTLFDVNEGLLHFESMSKAFGTAPSMDHYVGVAKMLASSGHLDEAFEFIEDMPVEPSIDVWETLMNLCRIHGNLETGDLCANIVALLDPSRLNVESKAGFVPVNPSDMQNKVSGQTPLRLQNRIQQFKAGDTSHSDSDKVYAHLKTLSAHMKESGYIPVLRYAMHDVDDESKIACVYFSHTVKYWLVFLIS
ncbi:pentatricopeptide repeat-containing protein At2g25580-like [Papaver somniferum]|uniref:pentatricopeptide repeat-containing protein At2g25580-like n=1 Tax=Papaver somniferum TaxID=3469 RepID=UPI000E6FEC11|nr:pentatricopeptide repeat-containing protein At2g25580-like [Papaver somniferum]